jgi:pyruvate/2-oxoglutarate dehydrogenase complex dihydrolipoamide acyltransferase (E2) component
MEIPAMTEIPFYEIKYPSSRQLTFDVGKISNRKHFVKALLEVDVTEAWTTIRQSRRTGNKISFSAWLIKVIADCVAIHPQVSGINIPWRGKVIVFNDVDISIVIEKDVNGILVPLPFVIRKAEQKTLFEIHDEIEAVKKQTVVDESGYVLGKDSSATGMRLYTALPQWLRLFLFRTFVLNHPQRVKATMGTVMITTVGMVGHTHGWIVPSTMHTLCLALGSLNEQPRVHKGEIMKRSILHLTVLIDHDVVDGMPAARFIDDLVVKLESGYGL